MIAQYVINGLLIGALYACIAVGFSLIWGVLNIINMTHGTLVVLGAYITIVAAESLSLPPPVGALCACLAMFVFGYAVQRLLIGKIVSAPIMISLTLTFGLDLLLGNGLIYAFTTTPRSLAVNYGDLDFLGLRISVVRVMAMGLALGLTGLLFWILRTSKIGRAIVAVRMDRHAATLLGIRVPQIYALTFGLGAAMAAAAGGAMAAIFPMTPILSDTFLAKSFVICVLGGLGSVSGALVGGLALGLVEGFGSWALGAQWSVSVGFVLMLLVLIFRPAGLVGRRGFE
jgi:branched-chain amino acid transport system permease protein